MGGGEAVGARPPARRHAPLDVAVLGRAERLVERGPVRHAVAEVAGDDLGVVGERLGGRPRRPAAGVLQRLREVPVVQRHVRRDARRRAARRRAASRSRARPPRPPRGPRAARAARRSRSGRRTRRGGAARSTSVAPAVDVIARVVAVAAVEDGARALAEAVPDAVAAARPGPLDLERRRRRAPHEAGREASRRRRLPRSVRALPPRTAALASIDHPRPDSSVCSSWSAPMNTA